MADSAFIPIPQLKPTPRRKKKRKERLRADTKHIYLYVVGTDNESFSKVGVSVKPYERMLELNRKCRGELKMCYFMEVERADGFRVEKMFHRSCRDQGLQIEGEWISAPRQEITATLRSIVEAEDVLIISEVGDTGHPDEVMQYSAMGSSLATPAFRAGVTPPKRGP